MAPKPAITSRLAIALCDLMQAEGGEPGDTPAQRRAWKRAEEALRAFCREAARQGPSRLSMRHSDGIEEAITLRGFLRANPDEWVLHLARVAALPPGGSVTLHVQAGLTCTFRRLD